MKLWNSKICSNWHSALEHYTFVIAAQHVNGLEEIDAWYRDALPALLASRTPPYITRPELERATVWKMKRGVWRERNRLLVIGNPPAQVEQISRQAFSFVPDPRKPVDLLSTLAGVGPATASAILACYAPGIYPFFDELVAAQIPGLGALAFTATFYQRYAAALRECAAKLNQNCPHQVWTAHALSQALWAASGGKAALV